MFYPIEDKFHLLQKAQCVLIILLSFKQSLIWGFSATCRGNFPCWNLKLLSVGRNTNTVWWIIFFNTCVHGEKTSAQCSLLTVRFSESYTVYCRCTTHLIILPSLPKSCKNYLQKHRKQDNKFQSSEKQDISTHSTSDFKVHSPARPLTRSS